MLRETPRPEWKSNLFRYSLPFLLITAALLVQGLLQLFVPKGLDFPYAFFYLTATFAVAWYGGYAPGVLSCLLIVVGFPLSAARFTHLPPVDPNRLALFIGVSLLVSRLAQTQRQARELLRAGNRELDERVKERTRELGDAVEHLSTEVEGHRQTELKLRTQLERLNLLDQITRAIGERQDLLSILQVVVRTLEDNLPIDFGCVCLYDKPAEALTVTCIGARSEALGIELAMQPDSRIPIDQNGLSRCVRGQLVCENDLSDIHSAFPERLVRAGLLAMVAAPLLVENRVFGVLISARREPNSFSSGECEFLRQLSEHVALAAHQGQIYSALQQAYDDLRQTQHTVMQQERLRALGQMASGIAHDINNALSPMGLYTEWLLEAEPGLSSRAREYLSTIQRAIGDVAQTVARLREFCRPQRPQLTLSPVDLGALVQQVLDLTRARWSDMPQQKGLTIHSRVELAAALPPIAGVESELREALTNLVFNALDAMPEGGTLTIRTRARQPLQTAPNSAAQVEVEVEDSGIGMDEETRRRCLEPFFTTKGERGTGLGLAMVYGVVQRHNANIEIDSARGVGTTIRISFPAIVLSENRVMPEAPAATPARMRILVVDDDPLLIKSMRDLLESDGHIITTANGGREGIAAFEASLKTRERFAVVITDLGMPYVDGRKVATAIKGQSPTTPVVLLTGWGQRMTEEDDIPPDVDRVMSKPPKLRDLRSMLSEMTQNNSPALTKEAGGGAVRA